jgi:hypothetical protein
MTSPISCRRPFAGRLLATIALAASACATPEKPSLVGFRLIDFAPSNGGGPKVLVPVELQVVNPNEKQLQIQADSVRIVRRGDTGERVLGVASFESPVVVGPSAGGTAPQAVETTLGVDRASWDRSILTSIREGMAHVVGPVEVLYDGKTYDTEIDLAIPGRSGEAGEEGPGLLSVDLALDAVRLDFRTLDDLRFEATLHSEGTLSEPVTLRDVTLTLAAEGTRDPLDIEVEEDIVLPAGSGGTVTLRGRGDLSATDPTLLDDMEADGRRARIRMAGTARSAGFPETDFDEVFTLDLDGGSGGPEVAIERPPLTLFTELVGLAERGPTVIESLQSVANLLDRRPATLSFAVNNPLPGTLTITESDIQLLGPYNPSREKRLEILTVAAQDQTLAPRGKSDVEAQATLDPEGRKVWRAVAVDVSEGDLGNYCLASTFTLRVPVLGEVRSEGTFGPVYASSDEDCTRR